MLTPQADPKLDIGETGGEMQRIMPTLAPDLYLQWRAGAVAAASLRETPPPSPPAERLLQQVWRHQRFRRGALKTLDGQRVTILHPGFWNREAGPDFRDALVQIGDDPPRSGDVEIDLSPDNWRQHGHHENPAYRHVRLHVVWEADAHPTALPTVSLCHALDAPLPELQLWLDAGPGADLPAGQTGRCAAALRELPAEWRTGLFAQAAKVRLQRKAAQFAARARDAGWEQALWEGLLAALGYKHNVWPMRRLAELRPRLLPAAGAGPVDALTLQARLLGVGGLLPAEWPGANAENAAFLRRLWDIWWREREGLADGLLPRAVWRLSGVRPANHPQRRLALAAHWLADAHWLRRVETWLTDADSDTAAPDALLAALAVGMDDFWSWHWTLRSARMPRPQPLLGPPRATDLAINVLLPWFWSRADAGRNAALCQRVEQRYAAWPAAEDNTVLRLARQRLLAGTAASRPRTAALQQGAIQVVRDFCDRSNARCEGCRFPDLVRRLIPGSAPAGARP